MSHNTIVLVSKGLEQAAEQEIKDLTKAKTKIEDQIVLAETTRENICVIAYKAQTLDIVGELLASFEYTDEEDLLKKAESEIKTITWKDWIDKEISFRVTGITRDTKLPREELAAEIGGFIINENKGLKVNLKNPELNILLIVTKNKAYLAVDYVGHDLHKREYKIFPNPASLRGTIAAALLHVAQWKTKEMLLDPFSQSGEICIEAALKQTKTSINFYSQDKIAFKKLLPLDLPWIKWFAKHDKKVEVRKPNIYCFDAKMPNVTAAKKNAKIAGIHKAIKFSRFDVDWIDTKLEKASVQKIITHPPEPNKFSNTKELKKLYLELFYQAEFILKSTGTVTIIQRNQDLITEAAKEKGFKIMLEKEVYCGQSPLQIRVYHKGLSRKSWLLKSRLGSKPRSSERLLSLKFRMVKPRPLGRG
ncbi:MAG: THUMP domain-containing protein [Nanoarchaeota archaeon]|nr:THUMP domain-containing protein [Nanoarchaeota archaeon]